MDYKKINDILADLSERGLEKKFKQVSSETPRNYWNEKSEGGEDVRTEVYEIDKAENIFLKIQRRTDSYGDNETLCSITFVKPIEVKVTVYEPVNN